MAVSEQPGDSGKTVEELQKEVKDLTTKYENLDKAHTTLKDDHRNLKATSSDAAELQKQIEKHVTDKSKLMREKDELQTSYDGYKKNVQGKDLKQHVTTALDAAGAGKRSPTALKLVDMAAIKFDDTGNVIQESVTEAIKAVQTSDPWLFEGDVVPNGMNSSSTTSTSQAPPVKGAVNRVTKSAYETEMDEAVRSGNAAKVEEVAQKYLAKA